MSYIVLARKWRPQGFDDLVGQEPVVKTFKHALSTRKIVHAYLFSGPRGVGKTSSARILAKALNCEDSTNHEPCGRCQSCIAITEGASVDVFEIDGASNTSVDSVRELRETVKYAPSGGRYKIYIIDEVHMLSTAAFNALLKTLEEPPPHVIFIFATTEPKKIPATILSRCQHHAFRRVPKHTIIAHLKKITDAEEISIRDAALEMIARAADGSIRDALTLLDQAYSFTDEITEQELHSLLGLPEAEVIAHLSQSLLAGDVSATLSIIKDLTDRGSDLRQLTRELVEHFRNIAVVKVTEDPGRLLEFSGEEIERFRNQAAGVGVEQLTLLLTELLRLESEVRNAVHPRYVLELGLLRTSFVKGMTSIDMIMKALQEPDRRGPADAPSAAPGTASHGAAEKKTPPTGPHKPAGSGQNLTKGHLWKKLIEHVDSQDHRLACKLAEAHIIDLSTTELSIGFNGGMSVLADSIRSSSSVIKPILQEISGRNLKLKILSLPEDKTKKDKKKIKEEISSEPLVRDALRIFEGTLINVKSLENEEETNE